MSAVNPAKKRSSTKAAAKITVQPAANFKTKSARNSAAEPARQSVAKPAKHLKQQVTAAEAKRKASAEANTTLLRSAAEAELLKFRKDAEVQRAIVQQAEQHKAAKSYVPAAEKQKMEAVKAEQGLDHKKIDVLRNLLIQMLEYDALGQQTCHHWSTAHASLVLTDSANDLYTAMQTLAPRAQRGRNLTMATQVRQQVPHACRIGTKVDFVLLKLLLNAHLLWQDANTTSIADNLICMQGARRKTDLQLMTRLCANVGTTRCFAKILFASSCTVSSAHFQMRQSKALSRVLAALLISARLGKLQDHTAKFTSRSIWPDVGIVGLWSVTSQGVRAAAKNAVRTASKMNCAKGAAMNGKLHVQSMALSQMTRTVTLLGTDAQYVICSINKIFLLSKKHTLQV